MPDRFQSLRDILAQAGRDPAALGVRIEEGGALTGNGRPVLPAFPRDLRIVGAA